MFGQTRSPLKDVNAARTSGAASSPAGGEGGGGLAALLGGGDSGPSDPKKSMSTYNSNPYKAAATAATAVVATPAAADAVEANLLKARVEHLERERTDLARTLHARDEKDRSRKLKIERLGNALKDLAANKTAQDARIEKLVTERDVLQRRLDSAAAAAEPASSEEGVASEGSGSVASQLAASLAHPPAYLAGGDSSTGGIFQKMKAAATELRRMEEECKSMQQARDTAIAQLETNTVAMAAMEERAEADRKAMIILKEAAAEADGFSKEIDELTSDNNNYAELLSAAVADKEKLQEDISKGMKILESLKAAAKAHEDDMAASLAREEVAMSEVRRLAAEVEESQLALSAQQENMDEADSAAAIAAFIAGGGDAQLVKMAEDLRARLRESEKARKKLHADIQDLKGNVRVLVRMRPFMTNDGDNREAGLTCNKDETSVSVNQANKPPSLFHFDHVFNDKSSQEGVFREVSELIQSSMDGYRVCIFSYGQTGSGKTWTMSGERSGPQRGIIPRAVHQIIEQSLNLKKQGWTIDCKVSVVELYNEEVKDLLAPATKGSDKLKIVNQHGRVSVQGLSERTLDVSNLLVGMTGFEQLMDTASRTRTTVATGMNDVSSRSHMVFMLEMTGVHADGVTVTHGGLRLVDLAGSERLDRTGTLNDAARLKETVNINKSLSSLADVFMSLGQKSSHVPYRNSKLTMLLQDCLSGTGKSMMIVNVSPTVASAQETLCSMRFADQVSQVELGKAQKQMYMQPATGGSSGNGSSNSSASAAPAKGSGLGKPVARKRNATAAAAPATEAADADDSVDAQPAKRTRLTARTGGWK